MVPQRKQIVHVCCVFTALVLCVCLLQYESSGLGLISSRLRTTLNRIQESLIDVVRPSLLGSRWSSVLALFFFPISPSPWLISSPDTAVLPPHFAVLSHFYASNFFSLFFFVYPPAHPSLPNESPEPALPRNALWVIIWPVVTHTSAHLSLFKWTHQGLMCVIPLASITPTSLL